MPADILNAVLAFGLNGHFRNMQAVCQQAGGFAFTGRAGVIVNKFDLTYLAYFRATHSLVARPFPVAALAESIVDGRTRDPAHDKPPSASQLKWRGLRAGTLRMCSCCGEALPATSEYFYSEPRTRSGLTAECKSCIRKRRKERYYRNAAQRASRYRRAG